MRELERINIELTPYEVKRIIKHYFGSGKKYKVTVKEEVSSLDGQLDIKYYLIEHTDIDGIAHDNVIRLTDGDVEKALNDFLDVFNLSLIEYRYVGEIYKGVVNYDGIKVIVKPKVKTLSRKKIDL